MSDRVVYVVRVFNPDGTPYLDPIGKSLAKIGAPAASGIAAYSEEQRDRMIATAQKNGYTATFELAPECRGR